MEQECNANELHNRIYVTKKIYEADNDTINPTV